MSETYFRFPDQIVLVSDHHEVLGPSRFELKISGVIHATAEAGGKLFWLLEPDLTKMDTGDLIIELIDDS